MSDALVLYGNNILFFLDLWAVINNAGISLGTPECEWCPLDRYQRVMDVNFIGVIRVTKAFLPLVRKSRGRIVNVASIAGICYNYNTMQN